MRPCVHTGSDLFPIKGTSILMFILSLSCALFVMILGAASYLVSRSVQLAEMETVSGSQPTTPTAPVVLLTYERLVTLSLGEVYGIVEVEEIDEQPMVNALEPGELATRFATKGMELLPGQRLRTGPASGALLLFSDGRKARLGASAELSLLPLDENIVAVVLYRGEVQHSESPSTDFQ